MKRLIFLVFGIHFSVFAQQESYINADRPDQSEGIYVLPKSLFQVEDGFLFSNETLSNNFMLRYGVLKKMEVRVEADFQLGRVNRFECDEVVLSTKYHLLEGKGWLPNITAAGYLSYQTRPEATISPNWTMVFEYEFTPRISFVGNVGQNNQFTNWLFTAELDCVILDNLGFFVEYFANTSAPKHNVDCGIMYAIKPRFQLDLAAGRTIFSDEPNYFGIVGFSYRFK